MNPFRKAVSAVHGHSHMVRRVNSTPLVLRISPALGGLATAAVVILLAAGPLSPEGDMTLVANSFQPVKEPVTRDKLPMLSGNAPVDSAVACGELLPRGWIVFCVRDDEDRCVTRVFDNEIWIRNSQQCWLPHSVVRFEAALLELSDPPGTSAGEDLTVVAQNAWDEHIRDVEKASIVELKSLFDQQRWRDLESRAKSLIESGAIYSQDGRKFAELRIADALSAQLEESIQSIEPRVMSLELDVESLEGVYMSASELDRQYLLLQVKALELNKELDKFVEGLGSWKELSGIIEFQFRASRQRLLDIHSRVMRCLGSLGLNRYASILSKSSPRSLGQYEGVSILPNSPRWEKALKWRKASKGCLYSVESAKWDSGSFVVRFFPTRTGIADAASVQELKFIWKGQTAGLVPVTAWEPW